MPSSVVCKCTLGNPCHTYPICLTLSPWSLLKLFFPILLFTVHFVTMLRVLESTRRDIREVHHVTRSERACDLPTDMCDSLFKWPGSQGGFSLLTFHWPGLVTWYHLRGKRLEVYMPMEGKENQIMVSLSTISYISLLTSCLWEGY